MLLCCASLCYTFTITARLAARCAPLQCPPSRGTQSCFHVLSLPCWSSASPGWCCDAGSELWQHFNCSITCAAGQITSERLQLTASCSELVRHRRRSVAQTFLGILGMLEAHACFAPCYWKTCFAECFARKSRTRKRASGDCVDHLQFRRGKRDWCQTFWKLPGKLISISCWPVPVLHSFAACSNSYLSTFAANKRPFYSMLLFSLMISEWIFWLLRLQI